jgi:Putative phage tail protein
MPTINDLKELEVPGTPLFLFECTLNSGDVQRWSTHKVSAQGHTYAARVLKHNMFDLRSSSDEGTDGISKISVTLANADSLLSAIERNIGWKGARLTVQFLFFDLRNHVPESESLVVFRGVANPPEETTESTLRLSFTNRLNLQRIYLPDVSIQKRCPWTFPATLVQLTEALDGGPRGKFSPFYRCGYSAGVSGGVGNLNAGAAFTTCDYTKPQCQQRGMFDQDDSGNVTRRFGGIEFVPSSVIVRSYGEKGSHLSTPLDNQARYNDFVPLVYGTAWYLPPIVFARNDGNLTHTEVLLGAGELAQVVKVIVNDIEIPEGVAGANMTATGWYNATSYGTRTGAFNSDFVDSSGNPAGDPYGSMAYMSVVVPNRISDGRSLPTVEVLVQGMKLARFDSNGNPLDDTFTNNPAWVLLDILRRSGWGLEELDISSFAAVAAVCDEPVQAQDLHGNITLIPRFQCNLIVLNRRSAADLVRGIRTTAGLFLTFSNTGLLQLRAEDTIASQQPTKPPGSNSHSALFGGWPVYEFGDNAFSGILRKDNGQPSFRTWARSTADTPNRFTIEFQDEFNEYQQDSLSLLDIDDALRCGQEVSIPLPALGIPNFDQATRITTLQLNKSVRGNTYVDFETSVRSVNLRPGDLITITYVKEGWDRQPFRVTRIAPGMNYRTAAITAQIHDDNWYLSGGQGGSGNGRQPGFEVGLPRPLVGKILDNNGQPQFDISETSTGSSDGSITIDLSVGFADPGKTISSSSSIPLVGLNPEMTTTGGTLAGNQNLYYAVTAMDASGAESGLSFTVKANVPAATNTNQVTLLNLSFPSSATGFNVYRGSTPAQMLQIATNVPPAQQFTDIGLTASVIGPPDVNYDHANFYWRLELQPEEKVDIHSANTIGNSTLNMLPDELIGATVRITQGLGAGQERVITAYTPTTLTLAVKWDIQPDSTSSFTIADSTWQFGASGATSPVTFEVPNRGGATVQVSGRAANVRDEEAAYELSPLTRWRISGAGDAALDDDVPTKPVFGLFPTGQGTVEVQGLGFTTLKNTRSITAGTLSLAYWDELSTPTTLGLSAALLAADTVVSLNALGNSQAGDFIQIDSEVMLVQQIASDKLSYQVTRGLEGMLAANHAAQAPVFELAKKTFIMPFVRDFFGSPAGGSYAYSVYLPDVRIAVAELFMTNGRGNSDVARDFFTLTVDNGMRTLSGGQLSIQVEGFLAVQTNAAPPISLESTHSVHDVFAVVGTAPKGSSIQLQVTQNGQPYCGLTIDVDKTVSNVVDGFSLGPLQAMALIGLDILPFVQTSDTVPASDLTVTIRL